MRKMVSHDIDSAGELQPFPSELTLPRFLNVFGEEPTEFRVISPKE